MSLLQRVIVMILAWTFLLLPRDSVDATRLSHDSVDATRLSRVTKKQAALTSRAAAAHVDVTTRVGTVRGYRASDYVPYIQFCGIPYAVVDETDPFGPSKPHPHFNTTYSAHSYRTICPQLYHEAPQGSIHCLLLNIFTPYNATETSTLPVIVYIHGGLFVSGAGTLPLPFTPEYLIANNIILITVNYRLGPYGFLCLPELGYSNNGIKDIVLALKWIKDNINGFGGDPDNILVFGHGAGSVIIELLLLYNKDNVFNKCIFQSGQMASPFYARESTDENIVIKVAELLRIDTKNVKMQDVMTQLSKVDTDLLLNVTKSDRYRPCIDDTFITKTVKNINMNDVKVIIGTTEKETYYFYMNDTEKDYLDKFNLELNKHFKDLPNEAVEKVKKFYLKGDLKDNVIDFTTDFLFNYPVERSVRYYLANNATVYRYVFSQGGGLSRLKQLTPASYKDDIGYIFGLDWLRYMTDAYDFMLLVNVTDMWTKFARYSNPTWSDKPSNNVNPWLQVSKESHYYMNISLAANFSVQEGPYRDRMDFWKAFYNMYQTYSKGFHFEGEYAKNIDVALT